MQTPKDQEGDTYIIAMRTWGELGNLLAAKTLGACLQGHVPTQVHVVEAEALFPRFAEMGRGIERIMTQDASPEQKLGEYLSLMTRAEAVFPARFESAPRLPSIARGELGPLIEFFSSKRPSLVIGTKGIISRLCLAAMRQVREPAPIVNFVTNQGLLELPLHRSRAISHHLVPFESARTYLVERHGYAPEQVHTVGRLLASRHTADFVERAREPSASARQLPTDVDRRVVVFVNRGGQPYVELLEALAASPHPLGVLFIGYNDPALVAKARELAEAHSLSRWVIVERLGQGEYMQSLRWLASGALPMLITKTGPNTVLEAAHFGVPQLLLASGLPMERWVKPFVEERSFGRGFWQMSELIAEFQRWQAEPARLLAHKRAAESFSEVHLNQQHAEANIRQRVNAVLSQAAAAA
jgi:hypothetical protein